MRTVFPKHRTAFLNLLAIIVFAARPLWPQGNAGCYGPGGCANTRRDVTMHSSQVPKSGIALGGIGAGFAELRQDGVFTNWQIFNNRPLGVAAPPPFDDASMLFFVIRFQEQGEEPRLKLLQIEERETFGGIENYAPVYIYPWMTGVKTIESSFRFPFGRLRFADEDMPFEVEMEAFSPFIPNDLKHSTLPLMCFDFRVVPKSDRPVDVMLMASFRNAVGYETGDRRYAALLENEPWGKVATVTCNGMDTSLSSYGAISLASLSPETSHYLGWGHIHPYYEIVLRQPRLPDIDDTDARNGTDRETGRKRAMYPCWSTLAVSERLSAGDTLRHGFVYAWYFPNRHNEPMTRIEGNYYANFFRSSAEVAAYGALNGPALRRESRAFQDGLYATTADRFVIDQINSHLNTFVTSGWLDRAGHFGILEGMFPDASCCGVATVDVSVYGSIPVIALFPELQKSTMRSHRDGQLPNGLVLHSLYKNFDTASMGRSEVTDRLDLPAQYAVLVMRDYFWSDDPAFLKDMWPSVKKAISYVLAERDKNGDGQPDMEGIMSSYDNFPMYGLASYIQSQWLAALAAASEGAAVLGDRAAETQYRALAAKGKALFNEALWNGRYFRLYRCDEGPHAGADEGCLTDQLAGQWLCDLLGLDGVSDRGRIRTALGTILEMSYRPDFGLRNCSWPGDLHWHDVPRDIWVDQANTCWSGVELAFASFLLYQGLVPEAMNVIRSVDERYRGAGLYFNHQECGGHYYRPMSAWAILNGMLGLSRKGETLSFAPVLPQREFTVFFALPGATAHYIRADKGRSVELRILNGSLACRILRFGNLDMPPGNRLVFIDGRPLRTDLKTEDGRLIVRFKSTCVLKKGQVLRIE